MKAPKVLLALGLSVPILVQGLSYHHKHTHAAEHDQDESAARVQERDVYNDHSDIDNCPPWIPHFKPSRWPPQAADVQHNAANGDQMDQSDPPKHHCNPSAPFCSDHPKREELDEGQDILHEKREWDTLNDFEAEAASSPNDPGNPLDDPDIDPEPWPMMFNEDPDYCFQNPEACWKSSSGPDDTTESHNKPWVNMPEYVRCHQLAYLCRNQFECGCKLFRHCHPTGDASRVTFQALDRCQQEAVKESNPEAKLPQIQSEEISDMQSRCALAEDACDNRLDCACDLDDRCDWSKHTGPNWDEFEKCASSHGKRPADDHIKRDVSDINRSSRHCKEALNTCQQGSSCACRFVDRCAKGDTLSSDSLRILRKCLHSEKRDAPRDGPPYPPFTGSAIHQGDVTTAVLGAGTTIGIMHLSVPLATLAASVSQASPVVILETADIAAFGKMSLKKSLLTTRPTAWVEDGQVLGRPFSKTLTDGVDLWELASEMVDRATELERRHVQATPMPQPGSREPDEAVTFDFLGGTAAFSVPDAQPNVVVATYGDETEAGTVVVSAIETDPPVIAVSGVWNNEVLPATTYSLEDFEADDMLDLSKEELEAKLDKRGAPSTSSALASASTTSVVVLGNNSALYFRTTDDQGRPIYVTRTGNYAARTTTVTFSESVPVATTTRQGENVEVRIITVTKTVIKDGRCTPHRTPMRADKTVLDLGTTEVPMTSALQTVNGTVMYFSQPEATMMPLAWQAAFADGWQHMFGLDEHKIMAMYQDQGVDWSRVKEWSWKLRDINGELTPELSFQRAAIMHLRSVRGDPAPYADVTHLHRNNVRKYFSDLKTVVRMSDGKRHVMTANTQTFDGTTVVIDPLAQYLNYDARYHRVVPTPACEGNRGIFRMLRGHLKKDCMIEKCMWKHMRPFEITTVFPAAMKDGECGPQYDYFTHKTKLDEPHWGTTKSSGIYYPVAWTRATSTTTFTKDRTKHVNAYPTCALNREYPPGYDKKASQNRGVHGDPECSDIESCHDLCKKHHGLAIPEQVLLALAIGIPLLIGLPILALLCCCVPYWFFRRNRRNRKNADGQNAAATNEKERRPSVMDKLRRKSTGQSDAVINAVSGQATDPATGRPVEGGPGAATAIMAGSAAGAAAAAAGGSGSGNGEGNGSGSGNGSGAGGERGSSSGDEANPSSKVVGGGGGDQAGDGKGTLGRQAEEGRSRVRFDEGTAPKAVPEGEPHVEATPAAGGPSGGGEPPKTDGTLESASGREWDGVGSVRGRKRARGDGVPGRGKGFGF